MNDMFNTHQGTIMKHRTSRGFTLIEVMMVVAIIGILVAAATPSYLNYVARARAADVLVQYDALRTYAIIEANNKGLDLCAISALRPGVDAFHAMFPPEKLVNRYVKIEPFLLLSPHQSINHTGVLTIWANIKMGAMNVAVAREALLLLQRAGMVPPGRTSLRITPSVAVGNVYLAEQPCP